MTDRDRWLEVDRIFTEALELPLERRDGLLRERCAGDPALLEEVTALLRDARDPTFLDNDGARDLVRGLLDGAAQDVEANGTSVDPLIGTELDAFRIVRRIGQGGMGSVYLAERVEGFVHQVAIKTLRRGIDTEDVIRRFLAERQILAELDHPNIARLFGGGSTPDGRPYFIMEFVRGTSITEFADERRLGVRERVVLLKTVASALQHAHQHLVVHRDLKPSNVLVNHEGVVKLLDFGIARLVGPEPHHGGRTTTGYRALTPAFAAPEQVARQPITTATDIYQLGVLMYELLSGVRPYDDSASQTELERLILDADPEGLPKALDRTSADAPDKRGATDRKALARALSGDLETIVAKSLAKEPARRYASADRFANDLDRHLEGRPIRARPATLAYRMDRVIRRNRWIVPAAASAILLVGIYLQTWLGHRRELADEAARAEAVTTFLADVFTSANPWEGGGRAGITVAEVLDGAARRVDSEFDDRPELQARLFDVIGASYHSLSRFEAAEAVQQRAVALRSRPENDPSIEALESLGALGLTLNSTQGPDSALFVLQGVLDQLARPETPRGEALRAELLGGVAWVLGSASKFDSAFAVYGRAHGAFEALDPPRAVAHATVMRHHSENLFEVSRYDEQLELAEAAVALLLSALPANHAEVAAARRELGSALSRPESGRAEEGLVEFDRALAILEPSLAADDPNLLQVRYEKAYALMNLGHLEDAEAEYRVLVRLYAERDSASESYGDALQNLAATVKRQGRLDEAVAISTDAHELYERALGLHYKTAYPLLTVAEVELARGRYAEGERLSSEAYDILSQTLPEGSTSTWVARCRRGRARWALGQREQGLEDMRLSSSALVESSAGPTYLYSIECTDAYRDAQREVGEGQ